MRGISKISKDISNEILISKNIANRLSLELGSKIQGYFQNQSSNKIPSEEHLLFQAFTHLVFLILMKI